MPYNNLIDQIATSITNIKNLDLESALAKTNLQPWNGLNQEDFRNSYNDLVATIESAIEQDALKDLPHNILNSLNTSLTNLFQQLNNFSNSKNQPHFQNSLSQLESNRTNIRTWGIKTYVDYGKQMEDRVQGFNAEYQKIIEKNREIEGLKESVNKLIEPAVAGSLSQSFSERQSKLLTNQRWWLALTIISGIGAIWGTFYVINALVELFNPSFPENATAEQIDKILSRNIPQNTIIFLRLGILIPLYTIFAYFFKHYNKERNLEEEYAHRAAVASSLPNYGNLAGAPDVKDQIISSASNVVFTSPIEKKGKESTNKSSSLGEVNSLLEKLTKIIKPNE